MGQKRKYRKKADSFVTAVQIDLDTPGFKYNKWGGEQVAKRGDWLVDNNGDKYTVAEDSFATTYEFVSPGVYVKSAPVWAEIADRAGTVKTQEGNTVARRHASYATTRILSATLETHPRSLEIVCNRSAALDTKASPWTKQ